MEKEYIYYVMLILISKLSVTIKKLNGGNIVLIICINFQAKSWDTHKAECKFIKQASPKQPTASLRLLALILFKIQVVYIHFIFCKY